MFFALPNRQVQMSSTFLKWCCNIEKYLNLTERRTRRITEYFIRPSTSETPLVQPEQTPADIEAPVSSSSGRSMVEYEQNVEKISCASKQVVPESHTQVDDISLWSERMLKELIDYRAVKDPEDLHHNDVKSLDAKSAIQNVGRKCTTAMFEGRNRNGEVVICYWLCFSPANSSLLILLRANGCSKIPIYT